jgi:hypothetical protein
MFYAALDSLRLRKDYWPAGMVANLEAISIILLSFRLE